MTMASRRVLSTVFMRRRANKSYGNGSGSGNGNGKVIIAGEFCNTPPGDFATRSGGILQHVAGGFYNTPLEVFQYAEAEFCNTPLGSSATWCGGVLQHATAEFCSFATRRQGVLQHAVGEFCNTPRGDFATRLGCPFRMSPHKYVSYYARHSIPHKEIPQEQSNKNKRRNEWNERTNE